MVPAVQVSINLHIPPFAAAAAYVYKVREVKDPIIEELLLATLN